MLRYYIGYLLIIPDIRSYEFTAISFVRSGPEFHCDSVFVFRIDFFNSSLFIPAFHLLFKQQAKRVIV